MIDVELQEFVHDEISRIFRVNRDGLGPSTEILSLPGFDSVRIYELILDCEKRYGIAIPEEQAMDVRTVGELVELIAAVRLRAMEKAQV
jgi:acyl carrier protein